MYNLSLDALHHDIKKASPFQPEAKRGYKPFHYSKINSLQGKTNINDIYS
jgi:hypothetical protein